MNFNLMITMSLALASSTPPGAAEPISDCPAQFPAVLRPPNLDCPSHGLIIKGVVEGGGAGYSVASAGDINNDGVGDLLIGTGSTYPLFRWDYPDNNPAGIGAGEAYVIFGDPVLSSLATVDLENLDGSNGFKFVGLAPNERFGLVVAPGGDINNDGIDDLIISNAEGQPVGEVFIGHTFVVFGQTNIGSGRVVDLAGLDGCNGFLVNGLQSGQSVSAAGDINADGIEDLLIGAPTNPFGVDKHVGRAYLIFGGKGTWPAVVQLSELAGSTGVNGTNGLAIQARPGVDYRAYGPYASLTVAGLGDINLDGFDDFIVGAPGDSGVCSSCGAGYVVFGGPGNWPAVVRAADLAGATGINGTSGFIFAGTIEATRAGWAVSSAGDVNHDGTPDVLIGAPAARGSNWRGRAYVIFGASDLGQATVFDPGSVDGSNGFFIEEGFPSTPEPMLLLGSSLSAAGDLSGDGTDDLLLGTGGVSLITFGGSSNLLHIRDEAFIVFGGPQVGADGSIALNELNGVNGFTFEGSPEPRGRSETSRSVARAGDINDDGFDDIIIGAPGAGEAGEAYVLWGCPQFEGTDCNANLIVDACEADCNANGEPDECDIANGRSADCDGNAVPDECQDTGADCNDNGIWDRCDIAEGTSGDCNGNGIPDECGEALGPPITEQPIDQEVKLGEFALFTVTASGFALQYRWRKDGTELVDDGRIFGSGSFALIISDVASADAGTYDCLVTDIADCSSLSDPATLTVLVPCRADLDGDGFVNVPDLIILLGAWGSNPGHPADFDGDGLVRVPDLIELLGQWGVCP